jgi:hypothetical protein
MNKKRGWITCGCLLLYLVVASAIIQYGTRSNPRMGALILGSFSTALNVALIITLGFVWKQSTTPGAIRSA